MSIKSFIISVVILSGTLVGVGLISSRGLPEVVKTNLENIPMRIGDFAAVEVAFSQAVYDELDADKHIYRNYSSNGNQVNLYIGYYGTAKGGRTPHNPYACFSSAGWVIVDTKTISVDLSNIGQYADKVSVNYMLINQGDLYNVVLHWYQSDGNKVLATGLQRNIQRLISKVLFNKNDGAFVRVSILSDSDGIDEAKAIVESFSKEVLTLLPRYWPEEKVL